MDAVKGNNDHILVVNHKGRPDTPISPETIDFLYNLPQRIEAGETLFTHSLPFVEELGLAGMVLKSGQVIAEPLFPGEAVNVADRMPFVVTWRGPHEQSLHDLGPGKTEDSKPHVLMVFFIPFAG